MHKVILVKYNNPTKSPQISSFCEEWKKPSTLSLTLKTMEEGILLEGDERGLVWKRMHKDIWLKCKHHKITSNYPRNPSKFCSLQVMLIIVLKHENELR